MLTQHLRELEEAEVITRTVYPVVPPKVEYALTEEGEKLVPALDMLCNWSTNYVVSRGIRQITCPSQRNRKTSMQEGEFVP
jgi:DNA-binding HxlR family transcriptional regulator